ncbi:MAG: hypothetical protein BWY71_02378 [Planctomycetes bacterium ADurb.Bin412]|nr:MAG: hypothetical protein BWY71_02378 [Planctomycetes bacterium ADurb.Bin412]
MVFHPEILQINGERQHPQDLTGFFFQDLVLLGTFVNGHDAFVNLLGAKKPVLQEMGFGRTPHTAQEDDDTAQVDQEEAGFSQ